MKMNGVLFIVVVASMVAGALSRGGGNGDSSSRDEGNFCGQCSCSQSVTRGRGQRTTVNLCANNTGTNNICGFGTSYLSCSGTVCSNATCPTGQLWNQTAKACVSCNAGQHIAANFPKCVCNQGTTWNCTSGACVMCPASSIQLADECFCNATGPTPFFSKSQWACKGCPGQYVTNNVTRFVSFFSFETVQVQVCQCPGANDIFNKRSVSCVTCPSGSTAKKARVPSDQDYCDCTIPGQIYNGTANTCACCDRFVLNSAGTACERASRASTTTPKFL